LFDWLIDSMFAIVSEWVFGSLLACAMDWLFDSMMDWVLTIVMGLMFESEFACVTG